MRRRFKTRTQAVIGALSDGEWHYGFDLLNDTGLRSGSLYPVLEHLQDVGRIEAEWRHYPGASSRKRYYRLVACIASDHHPFNWRSGKSGVCATCGGGVHDPRHSDASKESS